MMSDERNETYEQAMNFYRCIGRDMGLDVEEEEGTDLTKETLAPRWGDTILVDTLSRYVTPQVRMEDLTVAELWDCVEALMVLVDTRANKDLYKTTGEYKERKKDAWELAEEALKNAGLMEVSE
jgi:hypothetical protein